MPRVLLIDDDPTVSLIVREAIDAQELTLVTTASVAEGWQSLARETPEVLLLDVMLPDGGGLELFARIRAHDPRLPVIFITSRATSSTAIEAMRLGAYDFLVKPLDVSELRVRISRALEIRRLTRGAVEVRDPLELAGVNDLLIGRSAAMQQVYKAIGCVAAQQMAVLASGETGTGKKLVARAIHQFSPRADAPFVVVNCGLAEDVLESELFGHDRHGVPGAARARAGRLEQCAGGTLLLDEIGSLPLATQGKVLELLEEQSFERLGGSQRVPADVRIIASTSRDLKQMVDDGSFRPDLFYYLSGFTMQLPPLRQRLEDLPALARHFVTGFNHQFGKRIYRVSGESLDLLSRYSWPGNVGQLQSVLKQAVLRATGSVLMPEFFPADLVSSTTLPLPSSSLTDWQTFVAARLEAGSANIYAEATEVMEREVLTLVLRHAEGNQAGAAKMLGITRTSLRNRVRNLGIQISRLIDVAGMRQAATHGNPAAEPSGAE